MMTERRYGFRFSGVEGGLLVGSVLLASFLIFVAGVYVGREVTGRKVVMPAPIVRAPVTFPPDPIVMRTPPPNDALAMRTAATTPVPVARPGTKEKVIHPMLPGARPDTSQLGEREKPGPASLPTSVPSTEAKTRRTEPSPFVSEESIPSQVRLQGEPFPPKSPAALASHTEKRPPDMGSRHENGEKKPATMTVARAERGETQTRTQGPALEAKRAVAEKDAKPIVPVVKKTTKQVAGWRVQVGATTYEETAHDMARELRELGYSPLVSKVQLNGETLYRVRIGKFNKQGEAVAAVGRFRREGRFSQAYLVSE